MTLLRIGAALLTVLLALPVIMGRIRRRRGVRVAERMPPWPDWLWQAAAWINEMLPPGKWQHYEAMRIGRWAQALYPGRRQKGYIIRHGIRKTAAGYSILLATAVCVSACLMREMPDEMPEARLERASAEGAFRQVDVVAEIDGERMPMQLTVRPRSYTDQELARKMTDARAWLRKQLPGENEDLLHVRTGLRFETGIPDTPFIVEWQPEDYQLIAQDGSLGALDGVKFPVQTKVTALIRYREVIETETFTIRITGLDRSREETLLDQVKAAVASADEKTAKQSYQMLPVSVAGYEVSWHFAPDHSALWLLFTGVIFAGLMIRLQDERVKTQVRRRSASVARDYPGFVHQMVLLLGAGMTVRKSWDLMIEDCEKNSASGREDNWLYQEMLFARRQMQTGIPEVQVYRAFGERMPYPGYASLCRLLVQMIRTGSKGMHQMMLKEAQDAEKHRRDLARKMGETAGTKLLLPMMMLLLVVFAVIMLPAFLSM